MHGFIMISVLTYQTSGAFTKPYFPETFKFYFLQGYRVGDYRVGDYHVGEGDYHPGSDSAAIVWLIAYVNVNGSLAGEVICQICHIISGCQKGRIFFPLVLA